jgi:two-component system response regulator PilR (NtrC family)
LLREGYDVETAGTVGDAWQHLQHQTFSAIITDMRLPDGTGLECCCNAWSASGRAREAPS